MPAYQLNRVEWTIQAKLAGYDLNVLSNSLGISRRTLERHIRKAFRLSPAEWIRGFRFEHAAGLLEQGQITKQVCAELGFTSEANFCHQFHRHFGCTPREYVRRRAAQRERRMVAATPGSSPARSSSFVSVTE